MSFCKECRLNPCRCQKALADCSSSFSSLVPENPVDLFGSPFDCPKQKRTRRFASPNSRLPQDELDRLQECIEMANDLLRSLGSERNPENRRQLQLYFMELKGASVKAKIACSKRMQEEDAAQAMRQKIDMPDEEMDAREHPMKVNVIKKHGKIATAGRDFIQINPVGSFIFIPYDRLISIKRDECDVPEREPEFLDADRKTRRELAFNFGEFVKKDPDLVNLFFGISLFKQLKEFIGEDVKVRVGEYILSGLLVCVDEDRIQLQCRKEKVEVDLRDICFVEVLDQK
ncbi:MAG: hypothetical protein ACI33P_01195 [Lysinibacillus sp.]